MRRRSFLRLSAGVITAGPVVAALGSPAFAGSALPAGRPLAGSPLAGGLGLGAGGLTGGGLAGGGLTGGGLAGGGLSTAGRVSAASLSTAELSAAGLPGVPAQWAVVAADGSADFAGIQAAVDAVPDGNAAPFVILVRPGTYLGQVVIPTAKPFVELRGLGRRPADVVIADNRANGTLRPDGTPWGTSGSASVTIDGAGFRAANLTLANLFDEAAHPEITSRQAVAVLTRADRLEFDRVRFLGNQDTLYVNSKDAALVARAYFRDCYAEGDVDFIFGRATAVFDRCRIHSLNRGSIPNGYVTAPSTSITDPYGLLFTRCDLTSDAPAGTVFLGRPWHPSNDPNAVGQTVIRDSRIGAHIGALAWSDFGTWPWRDARFAEFHNRGPGALVTPDRPQLSRSEAAAYTPAKLLRGTDDWTPTLCR